MSREDEYYQTRLIERNEELKLLEEANDVLEKEIEILEKEVENLEYKVERLSTVYGVFLGYGGGTWGVLFFELIGVSSSIVNGVKVAKNNMTNAGVFSVGKLC